MLLRYILAAMSVVMALLIFHWIDPLYNRALLFPLLALVIFNTWYVGLGPGLTAWLFSLVGSLYVLLPPTFSLRLAEREDLIRVVLFFCNFHDRHADHPKPASAA